jgi:hypothetical protein
MTVAIDSPSTIRDAFNDAAAFPRLVALVSPTCDTCLSGARAVAALLDRAQHASVRVLMVWMKGEPEDSASRANHQATLHPDRPVRHFWDGGDLTGAIVAELLGRRGLIAWDIYLGYQAGTRWDLTLPMPTAWVHQMGEGWPQDNHKGGPDTFPEGLQAVVAATLP